MTFFAFMQKAYFYYVDIIPYFYYVGIIHRNNFFCVKVINIFYIKIKSCDTPFGLLVEHEIDNLRVASLSAALDIGRDGRLIHQAIEWTRHMV